MKRRIIPCACICFFCCVLEGRSQEVVLPGSKQLQQEAAPFRLLGKGKALRLSDFSFNMQYFHAGDSLGSESNLPPVAAGRFSYDIGGQLSIFQVPFQLQYRGLDGWQSDFNPGYTGFFSGNFDAAGYQRMLRERIVQQIKPEAVVPIIKSRMDEIRKKYEEKLAERLQEAGEQQLAEKSRGLLSFETLRNLQYSDPVALKNTLFAGVSVDKYREMITRRDELARAFTQPGTDTSAAFREADQYIRDFEGRQSVYDLVIQSRKELANDPNYRDLASHFPFTREKFNQYLSNPGNLKDIASRFGNLSGMQKMFTQLTHLNLGQNPIAKGGPDFGNVLNRGLDVGIMGRKLNAGFIAGKNNHVNQWMQSGLTSVVSGEYSGLTGFQLERGSGAATQQTLSVNFFNFANSPVREGSAAAIRTPFLSNANRQDAVVSYRMGFKLGVRQHIKLDVSKSMGTYRNMLGADSSGERKSASSALLGSEGYANYAAAVEYRGELLKTAVNVHVSKVGLGYNNPGNLMLNRGQTKLKWGLTRSWMRHKLQVRYQGEYRTQHFDPDRLYRYNSFSSQLRTSLRLRQGTSVSLSYQHNDFQTQMPGMSTGKGDLRLWQGTGNFRFRIKGKPLYYTANLNWQELMVPAGNSEAYRSRSLLIVSSASLPVNSNVLSWLVQGNVSNNKDYYFNTSFYSTELSYGYQLGKLAQLTSSLGYFANNGWNHQLGLRQQVSAQVLRKWDVSTGLDIKRAVRTIREDMANLLFFHISLTYRR